MADNTEQMPPLLKNLQNRCSELLKEQQHSIFKQGDYLFAGLFIFQWLMAILLSWALASRIPDGEIKFLGTILVGLLLISLPLYLIFKFPGQSLTRYTVAMTQAFISIGLIYLNLNHLEIHFHVFVSLAFLAIYRDWRVLVLASFVIVAHYFLSGIFWQVSI